MSKDIGVYTETMAKVYAAQGHWEKAAEIYRRLLTVTPARKDYSDALAEAEEMILKESLTNSEQLVPLFREWIELLFKCEKLQKLRNLKDRI